MLTVYAYDQCSTCRTALAWLTARRIPFRVKPIRSEPPSRSELERMLSAQGGSLRKICNTAGTDYRALQLGQRIDAMPPSDVLDLLAANGNLVKRPFVLGDSIGLVGFHAPTWSQALC